VEMDVVLDFVEENFDLEHWDVESCKFLPRALLLTCKKGGSVLVWKDVNSDAVCFSVNGGPHIKRYPSLLSLRRLEKQAK
jgi:hypothetical protein